MLTIDHQRSDAVVMTVPELLIRAKDAIKSGETSIRSGVADMRAAAEDMAAAQAQGATLREIGLAVGKTHTWVHDVLKWRLGGYRDAKPFASLSKAKRDRAKLGSSNDHGHIDAAASEQIQPTPDSGKERDDADAEKTETDPEGAPQSVNEDPAVDIGDRSPGSKVLDGDSPGDQDSAPTPEGVDEPSPAIEAPSIVPRGELATSGNLVLPSPGVAFLVGGLESAIIDVAVKIGATISTGGELPDYGRTMHGDVIWLSCALTPRSYLRPKFQAAGGNLQAVRYQEAKSDRFELPIRDLSLDLERLRQTIRKESMKLGCVIIDHWSDYFRFSTVEKTVESFGRAAEVLSEVAREWQTSIILPCQVPSQSDETVAKAVTAAGLYLPVDALFLVKRDGVKGALTPLNKDGSPNGRGFGFRLGVRDDERTVIWDAPSTGTILEVSI